MDFGLALWGVVEDGSTLANVWTIVWRVAIVLLGINAVIIVHEWGHFIVARLCGVRCDKFYIWFDAWGYKFFHFKWGDTEYGLGWLPLGGYVKMLGQEDNPGAIREEIERAKTRQAGDGESGDLSDKIDDDPNKVDVKTDSFAAIGQNDQSDSNGKIAQSETNVAALEELEKSLYAPDSYLSKNVLQRMAIISAGVFMNVVFAIVCGAAASLLGFPEPTSRLGDVMPGSPAWRHGIAAGDQVVALDGTPIHSFLSLQTGFLDGNEKELSILKPGSTEPITTKIKPRLQEGAMSPTIGVSYAKSLSLAPLDKPYLGSLSDSENQEIEKRFALIDGQDRKKSPDKLVRMNGIAVENSSDYERLSRRFIDQDVVFEFASDSESNANESTKTIQTSPRKIRENGVRLQLGPITAIKMGSPAEKAGLVAQIRDESGKITQVGDQILAINNEPILDPIKLPYLTSKIARTQLDESTETSPGNSIVLTVLRDGKMIDVPIVLPAESSYTGVLSSGGQMASDHLGVSFAVTPVVGGIDATVEQDRNSIGGTIEAIEVFLEKPSANASDDVLETYNALLNSGEKTENGYVLRFDEADAIKSATETLFWFTNQINYLPLGTKVRLTVGLENGEKATLQTTIREADDAFLIGRGFYFGVETTLTRSKNLKDAIVVGWNKTIDSMGLIFRTLENLGSNVSVKALGGPGMIVKAAYLFAGSRDGQFLMFLCLIGANLAVVNFLPIPVLDGGHIVFLLYEAIFRRPPNENIQVILSFIGLFLILALMFWVIWLDILRFSGLL